MAEFAVELLKTVMPGVYEAYMGFSATNPSPEELSRTELIEDIGEGTQLWDRIWTEVKGGE